MAWRDVHLRELEIAAHDAGLEDAVRRAWFDALRAAVRACEDRMNAELFYLHYWNLATESRFTESAGLAAVAIALGDALSASTRAQILLPWTAAR
jgi:squalene cyclase